MISSGILLIGYGNELRADDGAGPVVVRELAASEPAAESVVVHQLLPELAERLAAVRFVVFVDAGLAPADAEVDVRRIEPAPVPVPLGHVADPRSLLALTHRLHGRVPEAWQVTVPGQDFGLGQNLSPRAQRNVHAAVRCLTELIHRPERADPD
jgi:hydrogenase maturation protease